MFQQKCQSVNYNKITTDCQLLDRSISNRIEVDNEDNFENHKDWVYYGHEEEKVVSLIFCVILS